MCYPGFKVCFHVQLVYRYSTEVQPGTNGGVTVGLCTLIKLTHSP
jgi:hypothetical protein